jgi:DnaA family protein
MQQLPLGVQLPLSSRFETFYTGDNAALVAELKALCRGARQPALWLWGSRGTGKTHLLQAACARVSDSGGSAAYLPLAGAAAMGPGVLDGLETLEAVLLDDLTAIAGIPEWERALFTLYNELAENGGRLVVAASGPPAWVVFNLPDLASRLAASSVYQVRALDEADQAEALFRRAAARGVELPPETVQFLMRRVPRDFAVLCRLLDEFDVAALAAQRRLTVPFVRSLLEQQGY